jgi:hypothetical protein
MAVAKISRKRSKMDENVVTGRMSAIIVAFGILGWMILNAWTLSVKF